MCIYPHLEGDQLTYNNEAHIITQGLGQNDNTFPAGVLCDRCNSYFGTSIEPALLRHPSLAHDMQRLGVPGRDGGPREILGNWQRSPDGAVLVPMAPPQDWRERGEAQVGLLPILDPSFDQVRFLALSICWPSTGSPSCMSPTRPRLSRCGIRAMRGTTRFEPTSGGGGKRNLGRSWSGMIPRLWSATLQ
jgi:HNH endonuclease